MTSTFRPLALAAAFACLVGCAPMETQSSDLFSATGELIALSGGSAGAASACFSCHGLRGQGDGGGSPRLAALDAGYLQRQLEAYADGRRKHPEMGWIARQLGTAERLAVSGFYAAMPFQASAGPDLPAPALFERGDPQRGIPACASCHGRRGEGAGPANPPLAGQPAPYLEAQIDSWRRSDRRNDPGDVMLRISQLLTPSESAALAAYAARLPGDPRNPESPEASREARRDDPRNGASAPPLHVPESARAGE